MAAKDLLGVRFEKLLVVGRGANRTDGTAVWKCLCDCGEVREIPGTALRAGRNKSCGCASPRFTKERTTTHGQSRTRTYRIWQGMRRRCSEAAQGKSRRLYFDKGIRVCERWEDFECFLKDMGHAPPWASIERINGKGDYEPGNCRWATAQEQANNVCTNTAVTHAGKTQTVAMWAKEIGVKPNTLLYRLRRGMPPERALQVDAGFIGAIRAAARERACAVCGAFFIPRPAQVAAGRGIYCSQACHGKARRSIQP